MGAYRMIYEDGLTTLVVEHPGLAACRADIKQQLIADFEGSTGPSQRYGWVIQELLDRATGPGIFMSNSLDRYLFIDRI